MSTGGKGSTKQDHYPLLHAATCVLDKVNREYGSGDAYLDEVWGKSITKRRVMQTFQSYCRSEHLSDVVQVRASSSINCSAHVVTHGPPRRRIYCVTVRCSDGNCYMRDKAIWGLAFHEIGTHVFRSHNDGFQVWHKDRRRFGLCKLTGRKMLLTEEGLATINAHLALSSPLLWKPALLYYAVCKAQQLDGDALMADLGKYIENRGIRQSVVRRLKSETGLGRVGGRTKDLCYFSGAVKLLRRLEEVDMSLLLSGKIAIEDLSRVKRISRTCSVAMPSFASNIPQYVSSLERMKHANELLVESRQC